MRSLPRFPFVLTLLATVSLAPLPADATLVGQLVGATLSDGGSLDLFDTFLVAEPGPEITPGDGSQIGGVLLPTESIDVGDQSLSITLEEGAPGGLTGYPAGTTLVFSNLVFFDVPTVITGISVSTVNITNLTGVSFIGTTVTIPMDALVIGDLPGVNTGSIQIDLEFAIVPEPGSAALAALGLGMLGLAQRGRRRAS